uniref:Uncharacterized protein n=1 Tax=Glossina pallidipes TaxID=7398 RepID=A0A1B0AAH5_GLOPL
MILCNIAYRRHASGPDLEASPPLCDLYSTLIDAISCRQCFDSFNKNQRLSVSGKVNSPSPLYFDDWTWIRLTPIVGNVNWILSLISLQEVVSFRCNVDIVGGLMDCIDAAVGRYCVSALDTTSQLIHFLICRCCSMLRAGRSISTRFDINCVTHNSISVSRSLSAQSHISLLDVKYKRESVANGPLN